MKILMCEQRSPEWFEARRGIPTASEFSRIVTSKGDPSTQAEKYARELAGARLALFRPVEKYVNDAMRHGSATEAEARRWYEFEHTVDVTEVGFVLHDSGRYGCSPDGFVGDDGGLELKCPQPDGHIEVLEADRVPPVHLVQVHGCLAVTGRAWWDYVSYCPGMRPFVRRIEPGPLTDRVRELVEEFCDGVDAITARARP